MTKAFCETEKDPPTVDRLVQSRIEHLLDHSYTIGRFAGMEWACTAATSCELSFLSDVGADSDWEYIEDEFFGHFPNDRDVDGIAVRRGFLDGAISMWELSSERVCELSSEVINDPNHPLRTKHGALFARYSLHAAGQDIEPIQQEKA
jgi:hypothetical protein